MREENELIARFMGGTKQIVGPDGLHGYKPGTVLWRDVFDDPGTVTYLLFDSDWDWLMPVVERIETLDHYRYGFTIDPHGVMCLDYALNEKVLFQVDQQEGDSKIRIVHEAVIEFVKMYTTTQQEQKQ